MTTPNWHQRANEVRFRVCNMIDGQSLDQIGAADSAPNPINKYSPRDGKRLYQFGVGTAADVNRAVSSARQAFEDGRWQQLPLSQRQAVLRKLADLVEARQEEFALYECLDVGKSIGKALNEDIPRVASVLRDCAEKADKLFTLSGADAGHFAYQRRKPVGVVGGIIGWNYPLTGAARKVGAALATGNSLVLKPSEFTPLSASLFAELALDAGVPPGVFNLVNGAGNTVGAAMAAHGDIDLLSFVGSSATGRQVMQAAGQSNMKRLVMECGGKSPYLVFNDCLDEHPDDLDALAADIVAKAFPNQGALCIAGTRLLVQREIKPKLLPRILTLTADIQPGDPFNPSTTFGALVNEAHMNKVLAYIDSGTQEGATLIHGGQRVYPEGDQDLQHGFYIEPTIFDNVKPQHKIAQEEIFGPVLSVLTFDDEHEAIELANHSRYGLAAYAATTNLGRAQRLGQQLNTGYLSIVGSFASVGGYVDIGSEKHRQSGFGYSGGLEGLAAYTTTTSVHIET